MISLVNDWQDRGSRERTEDGKILSTAVYRRILCQKEANVFDFNTKTEETSAIFLKLRLDLSWFRIVTSAPLAFNWKGTFVG